MHSDQMRKYGISESMIQALYYDIVGNKVIIRACIMHSEMPYFLIWSLCIKRLVHHAVYCISLSCLLSFLCNRHGSHSGPEKTLKPLLRRRFGLAVQFFVKMN